MDLRRFADCDDARRVPVYAIAEAARYVQVAESTLRSWVAGRDYPVAGGKRTRRFHPLIRLPDTRVMLLSFFNLAEAHVLAALRREHRVPMNHIRTALRFVTRRYGWDRPLVQQQFKTDGVRLFVEELGRLIDASAAGQTVMRRVVEAHLRRLEWEENLVVRFFPFLRRRDLNGPKYVLIDPRFSFGRPVLKKSHIATTVIAERYTAGDSIRELCKDYGCPAAEIEEALRCELAFKAAA